jgi:hypothetical protein
MYTLTERLYESNVLLSYYGFFDSGVLDQVLLIARNKMEDINEVEQVINKVSGAIGECMGNIIEYNFFPEDAILNYKSLLLVSVHNRSYSIDTINVINEVQKRSINKQLEFLRSKTKEELQGLRLQIMRNNRHPLNTGIGLGLIELMLGADRYNYRFKDYGSNFLFNINFEISALN